MSNLSRRAVLAGTAGVAATAATAGLLAGTAGSAAAATTASGAPAGGKAPKVKPTIVLVHGAWADSSCWAPVTARLEHNGYTVLSASNPLRKLSGDARYVAAFVQQRTTGPVVLVGHSYGGAVITNAATACPSVTSLVYVDAFVPDQGETVFALQNQAGPVDPTALFDFVAYPDAVDGDVDLYIKQAVFPQVFAADLPKATAAQLASSQRPATFSSFNEASGVPAWKTLPSWYVLGTADAILPASVQSFMATRAKSHVTQVKASHLSMLAKPDVVAQVIRTAAGDC